MINVCVYDQIWQLITENPREINRNYSNFRTIRFILHIKVQRWAFWNSYSCSMFIKDSPSFYLTALPSLPCHIMTKTILMSSHHVLIPGKENDRKACFLSLYCGLLEVTYFLHEILWHEFNSNTSLIIRRLENDLYFGQQFAQIKIRGLLLRRTGRMDIESGI